MNRQHLTILTGASRGLGRAMAAARLAHGHRVLTMSRTPCDLVAPAGAQHIAWAQDLADTEVAAARLGAFLAGEHHRAIASVTIVHNAGVLSDLASLGENRIDELSRAARVNLEAPLLLTAAFLQATEDWGVPRKILFISSGLARFAVPGCASYCATKAGLDHLARAIALEEVDKPNGARVVSLAPGVVDTDMQVQLRGADPAAFASRDRFVAMHERGHLASPAAAAAKVLAVLDREDFGSNPIADVREI
jgi:benzil reductase ((S)-benzoin forming)